jgi:hypothetical protein
LLRSCLVHCGRDEIGTILDWLHVVADSGSEQVKNRVFFRENAAQHWNTTSYGYQTVDSFAAEAEAQAQAEAGGDGGSGVHSSVSCSPVVDAQNSLDWRNREVHTYIHNENLHNIQFIPFRDVTAPLFNMHHATSSTVNNNMTASVDCTNFCFFPQLWQIVWTHMVEKIDIL